MMVSRLSAGDKQNTLLKYVCLFWKLKIRFALLIWNLVSEGIYQMALIRQKRNSPMLAVHLISDVKFLKTVARVI